ncbi:MAG: DUF624 domain-containing protein [Mycetocola sp.]
MNESEIGWAGRVMLWLRFGVALVVLNLLFVAGTLAGLVVFGLFPAAVATSIVAARMRAGVPPESLVRDFIAAYRGQFRHLAIVALPFHIAAVVIALDLVAFQTLAASGSALATVLLAVFVASGVTTLLAALAAISICARYRTTARAIWRYAVALPLISPGTSASVLVSLGVLTYLLLAFGVLVPLVGASVPLFVAGWLLDARITRLAAGEVPAPFRQPRVAGMHGF